MAIQKPGSHKLNCFGWLRRSNDFVVYIHTVELGASLVRVGHHHLERLPLRGQKKHTKTFTFECKHGGREVGHPKRKQQELTVGVIEGTTILCNKERRCT